MKILFAAPDRDLLECFKQLLAGEFGETVTAFDGTQVLTLLSAENFDAVILDRALPRVDHKTLVARIREKDLPSVVLTDEPVSARLLTDEVLPNEYLSYPFDAKKLSAVIKGVLEKSSSAERINVEDVGITVREFRIKNGPGLTAGEIDVLKSLIEGRPVTTSDGAYISALNAKFAGVGSKVRIRYRAKKGFIAVTENE
ncbi:MAG: hypothetical protein IKI03_01670 [Clostridia bacterium]|nr:hypothetical protein [Clostridia bacterium]